jgi:hypothetical protein
VVADQHRIGHRLDDRFEPHGAFLRRFMDLRALDGGRDALGHRSEQAHVVFGEVSRSGCRDMERATQSISRAERHTDKRGQQLLEDRVDHLHLFEITNNDRFAIGGDFAGDAAPHGNRHIGIYVCLKSTRRAHMQQPVFVWQQDHGVIGV